MNSPARRGMNTLAGAIDETAAAKLAPRARRILADVCAAREENAARRERVLRYPDLAARLTEPPLTFRQPEDWNGYVPPRTLAEDTCEWCPSPERVNRGEDCRNPQHLAKVNDSPRRAALIEICAEAFRREQEETPAAG